MYLFKVNTSADVVLVSSLLTLKRFYTLFIELSTWSVHVLDLFYTSMAQGTLKQKECYFQFYSKKIVFKLPFVHIWNILNILVNKYSYNLKFCFNFIHANILKSYLCDFKWTLFRIFTWTKFLTIPFPTYFNLDSMRY